MQRNTLTKSLFFLQGIRKWGQIKCALGNELIIDKWDPPNSSFDSSCCWSVQADRPTVGPHDGYTVWLNTPIFSIFSLIFLLYRMVALTWLSKKSLIDWIMRYQPSLCRRPKGWPHNWTVQILHHTQRRGLTRLSRREEEYVTTVVCTAFSPRTRIRQHI